MTATMKVIRALDDSKIASLITALRRNIRETVEIKVEAFVDMGLDPDLIADILGATVVNIVYDKLEGY